MYVGTRRRAQAPPNLAPQINTGQLDIVVLVLVDVIGFIVISLSRSRCCLPIDEGLAPHPQIFFPRTAPGAHQQSTLR